MIKVLRDWSEIGQAIMSMSRLGLPKHLTPEKSWDLYNLYNLVLPLSRNVDIVDLGCGKLHALKMLYDLRFKNLSGIDLSIPYRLRLSQLSRMWKSKRLKMPFRLRKMDITKTDFPDGIFELAVAISTIEHGVDIEKFFAETARILKLGGMLFLSTDYWEEKVQVTKEFKAYGLPWKVFDKKDLLEMITIANKKGLSLLEEGNCDFNCREKCIIWGGQEYTFICAIFKKRHTYI
jgi:SAM-dependent methyltransferase